MDGLWGKPGVPKIWGCHHSGETSSAEQKREIKCTMHLGYSVGLNLGSRSSPLQRCRRLETATGGNATLGLATFMSVPNAADPDVMLQRSFDDGD